MGPPPLRPLVATAATSPCSQNPNIEQPVDEKGNPRTRIMQATEMRLEVAEVLRDKRRMLEGFSRFTGESLCDSQR